MAKELKRTPKATLTSAPSKFSATSRPVTKPRTKVAPTEEQIRARAFEIYLARNGGPGDADSDWAQAERELIAELGQ